MSNTTFNNFSGSGLNANDLFSTQGSLGITAKETKISLDPPILIDPPEIEPNGTEVELPTLELEPIIVTPNPAPPLPIPELLPITPFNKHFNLNFSSSGSSIWGLGTGTIVDRRFLGKEWDKSGQKTFAKVGVYGSTQGKVGLQSDFELDGGSVNASLPIDLKLALPDKVTPGETVTIKSRFAVQDDASFATTNPYFDYNLDFLFDVNVEAGIKVPGGRKSIVNIDRNYDRNLVDLDSRNASYSVSESQLDGLGSFDIRVPEFEAQGTKIDADSLSATNSDTFLNANLDLDGLASSILPIPPLQGSFDKSIAGFGAKGSYNLLDLELDSEVSLRQEFDLDVDKLTGQLILENGDRVGFTVGEDITFTVPENIGDSLEVDAVVAMDANFRNQTHLGFDVDLDMEALALSGNIKIPIWSDPGFSFGPLYQGNFDVLDAELQVYNRTFDLGGFNTQSVSFEIDSN